MLETSFPYFAQSDIRL